MTEFWMVWCEEKDTPHVKHWSASSAQTEAERLARLRPGVKFYVLKCTRYACVNLAPVEWVALNELPF